MFLSVTRSNIIALESQEGLKDYAVHKAAAETRHGLESQEGLKEVVLLWHLNHGVPD